MAQTQTDVHPERAIRRFDVFAEYTRQERLDKGDAADEAKGYGVWLAKVVAARRFGAGPTGAPPRHDGDRDHDGTGPRQKFRLVGDELQTDEVFDHDIVERMGPTFYRRVFKPAIEEARSKGKSYEEIRDAIRRGWKPTK